MLIIFGSMKNWTKKRDKWLTQWLAEYKKAFNRKQLSKTKLICPIAANADNQISQSNLKKILQPA